MKSTQVGMEMENFGAKDFTRLNIEKFLVTWFCTYLPLNLLFGSYLQSDRDGNSVGCALWITYAARHWCFTHLMPVPASRPIPRPRAGHYIYTGQVKDSIPRPPSLSCSLSGQNFFFQANNTETRTLYFIGIPYYR